MTETRNPFEGWSILELMGHKTLAGWVTYVDLGGASVIRIDVPADEDGDAATQFYNSSALYCLTPVDEDTARRVAKTCRMAPVERWHIESSERRAAAIEAASSSHPGQDLEARLAAADVGEDVYMDDEGVEDEEPVL